MDLIEQYVANIDSLKKVRVSTLLVSVVVILYLTSYVVECEIIAATRLKDGHQIESKFFNEEASKSMQIACCISEHGSFVPSR